MFSTTMMKSKENVNVIQFHQQTITFGQIIIFILRSLTDQSDKA